MSLMSLKNAHKQGACDISDINFIKKTFVVSGNDCAIVSQNMQSTCVTNQKLIISAFRL